MDVLEVAVIGFWSMLPAYLPNNVAVLAGGGRPIDGGRTWGGDRLLGDGKTWRGTAAGTVAGMVLAILLNQVQGTFAAATGIAVPVFPLIATFTLPFGAMLGDILASLIKRRTGRERGKPFPGVDQLDFVVVSLVMTAIAVPGWFFETFQLPVLGFVVLATPALHLLTNFIAFKLELKSEPY